MDFLGKLEIEELDGVTSFASKMAKDLISGTKKRLVGAASNTIKRTKILENYSKRKKFLLKYLQSAPFARI